MLDTETVTRAPGSPLGVPFELAGPRPDARIGAETMGWFGTGLALKWSPIAVAPMTAPTPTEATIPHFILDAF